MEEENFKEEPKKDYKMHLAVFLTFFLTSLIVGGLAFFCGFKETIGLKKHVNILNGKIIELDEDNKLLSLKLVEQEQEKEELSKELQAYKNEKKESAWVKNSNAEFHFSFFHPKTWELQENYENSPFIKLTTNNTRLIISPLGDIGRGLWMSSSTVKNIFIDGKEASRQDWFLENGQRHAQIKFTDVPDNWNEFNNIIIENIQDNLEEVEKIVAGMEFIK